MSHALGKIVGKIAPTAALARLIWACRIVAYCIVLGMTSMAYGQSTETNAAESGAAEGNVTQFQDWVVQCAEIEGKRQCVMLQQLKLEEQSGVLLKIELSRIEDGGVSGIIIAPFGLDVTKGVSLSIDGGMRWNLPYRTCQSFGCVIPLTADIQIVDIMKNSEKFNVFLYTVDGGNTLEIPVSLAGFTAAYFNAQ